MLFNLNSELGPLLPSSVKDETKIIAAKEN